MNKLFLVLTLVLALATIPAFAHEDGNREEQHHGEEHQDFGHQHYGYDHGHDRFSHSFGRRDLHEYHVWLFDFPPPLWLPLGAVWCRDYTVQAAYFNEYGNEYVVLETHVECMDAFGTWRFVR